jgi:putative solute:sodium symporter small subunit
MSSNTPDAAAYWRANLRLLSLLLLLWAGASFGLGIVFVEPLNALHVAGFPLGFWFAQQGSIYIFFLLILAYAFLSDRMAKRYGVQ